jgi:hypothetical protein
MHKQPIKLVLLEKEFDQLLTVLLAAEGRLDVEHGVFGRIYEQLFAKIKTSESLESLPIINKTVVEDAFRVRILAGERVIEVHLNLFASVLIDLNVLYELQLTEGAMTSGLSLPAKPILVLSDPTYMMRGMPYRWLNPCGMYIDSSYKEHYEQICIIPLIPINI